MNILFDISPELPPGFSYFSEFITETEEAALLNYIQTFELPNMKFHEYEAKRKVKSFGRGWSFTDHVLKAGDPIPQELNFLTEKIAAKQHIPKENIAQVLLTEYPVGSVINWHRDAPPFQTIAGVSLLSDCRFKLRPHEKEKQTRSTTITLDVRRRSLYIMSGLSKTDWQHSTMPVNAMRYSLTFRTISG